MSVLECNRWGCTRIMCDLYSSNHGYICWQCFEELKATCNTVDNIDEFIGKFMRNDIVSRPNKDIIEILLNEEFNED